MKKAVTEPEYLEITAFGHKFHVLSGLAEDLITLEREGAIYSHFWNEETEIFKYNRIKFLPSEIFQYVEAHVAKQEFDDAVDSGASFEEALNAITNHEIADRVRSYGNYGNTKLRDGTTLDIRGCAASFYGDEIESLVCGARPDRYEVLPNLENLDKPSMLIQMLDYFPVVARHLAERKHDRPSYLIENEYDVQDLIYANIRSVFGDARLEEWTPKHGGKSKRIDIVVPSAEVVIEIKFVRDKTHGKNIGDELKIDIESYHSHASCKTLLFLIYDPDGFIMDPAEVTNDLSGRRVKGTSSFDVQVLVRK
ncbi:MAG: hypothetical protein JAZ17_25155 [Candidatus Thiodiazotropha endolucinida]|nr:hypothetical protein [Candidatus Thiodiazotropha endolucinida]